MTWIAIGFQIVLAYGISLIIYQVGSIFIGSFTLGSIFGLLFLGLLIYLLSRKNKHILSL